ncbi:MAG: HEAT repeat domain-containing protein, partial [Planctomycetota bacterium]
MKRSGDNARGADPRANPFLKAIRSAQPVVPFAAVAVIVYAVLFGLLHIFSMASTFEEHAVAWLRPGAWGVSALGLAKTVNVLFLLYLLLALVEFAVGADRKNRAHGALYLGGIMLLVLLQVVISRTGDLARHTYHTVHGERGRYDAGQRIEHFSRAIELFPDTPLSAEAYLGRAHTHRLLGEHDRAVLGYTSFLNVTAAGRGPSHMRLLAYCGRSISHRALGHLERAEDDAGAAARLLRVRMDPAHLARARRLGIVPLLVSARRFRALGELGDAEAVPGLIRVVEEGIHMARRKSAKDEAGGESMPPTLGAPEHRAILTQWRMCAPCRALGKIGDPRGVKVLALVLEHVPYVETKETAAIALGEIGDPAAVPILLKALSEDNEKQARYAALFALHTLSSPEPFLPVVWEDTIWSQERRAD